MKKLKFKSLTMRIWVTFTSILLIIILCISVFYLFAFRRIDENAKIADLKVSHDTLKSSNNFNEPQAGFGQMKNLKESDYFIVNVVDNKKNIIDVNKNSPLKDMINNNITNKRDAPPLPRDFNRNEVRSWMAEYISGQNISDKQLTEVYKGMKYIFIISSISYDGSGKHYLISYIPYINNNDILYSVSIIGLIFIAIGFLTSKVVAGYISKPLKKLEDYTVKIAHKDWKEPIVVKNEDEIGRLADAMNQMQNELKRTDKEEKMFLQSISHDLKTPVMVIMSHAEAIIDGVYIDSPEKTAEIIRDEAVYLEKKIKKLLYLNTLDYVMDNNMESEKINLKELLLSIINRFEAVSSSIEWDLKLIDVNINGNMEKIRVSLENIIDNSLRYAVKQVGVYLREENGFVEIEIYNDGRLINEEHIGHIFDNLFKDKTGNFGLGLAISKKVIDFYKGDIKAVNRENGVSFIIRYPISSYS